MKRKPLKSVQSLFKALIYGAVCLFLLSVFSCSDEMNMGSLNFGGDIFDGIQKDLSSDCLVEFSDGYNSCHVKMPFKKTYTKDALIDFFKKNRLLSAVNPGYYPENWKFAGFQDSALDASTNIDKSRFYTDDGAGCISVLTVPPYDFILEAGSWKIRTDTPYTVVFLFQSAEDRDIYEQLASHQPFILFGGTGVAFDDAFANTIYTANQGGDLPPGFEFGGLDDSSDTEIKADGTSLLKIRLKRKFVEILFYTSESSTESYVSVGGLYGQSVSADSAPKLTSDTRLFITGWKDSEENTVEIPETFPADTIKLSVASSSNNLYLDPSASSSGSGLTPSSPFNKVTDLNNFINNVFNGSEPSPYTIKINFLGTLTDYSQITELKSGFILCRYVSEESTADFAILSPETTVLSPDSTVTLEDLTFDGGSISSAASLINLNKSGISLTLKDCTLKNNYNTSDSQPGGAVTCTAGNLVLESCTITSNHGTKGGGIYVAAGSFLTLDNSVVDSNKDGNGNTDDIYVYGTVKFKTSIYTHKIVLGNSSSSNGKVAVYSGLGKASECTDSILLNASDVPANTNRVVIEQYDSSDILQTFVDQTLIDLFTLETEDSYIDTDGQLYKKTEAGITLELSEIPLVKEIDTDVVSISNWPTINISLNSDLSDYITTDNIKFSLYQGITEISINDDVFKYEANFNKNAYKLSFEDSKLDPGLYTLILSLKGESGAVISTYSQIIVVNY